MRTTTQSSLALDACGIGAARDRVRTQQPYTKFTCSNGTAWNCVVPGNVWFRLVLNVPGHIHGRRCCRAWTAHVSGAHQPADLVEDSRATWPSPWLIAH